MTTNRSTLLARALVSALAVGLVPAGGAAAAPAAGSPTPPAARWSEAATAGAALHDAVRESVAASTAAGAEYETYRIAGPDRYATSVEATRAVYTDEVIAEAPVGVMFVASGTDFPDALSATALVSAAGPLLLVPSTGTVPVVVLEEVRRLAPEIVVVVGGTGAVSSGVELQLGALAPTDRVAGADRYDTAARVATIADLLHQQADPDNPLGLLTLYVVGGANFPDALAAGAATGTRRGGIVLTRRDSLPAVTAQAVQEVDPQRIVVVGGTGTVSSNVVAQLRDLAPDAEHLRSWGADRYATAAAVSRSEFVHPGGGVALASGENFPDALSAAGLGASVEYALLLTHRDCAPAPTVVEAMDYALSLDFPLPVIGVGGTAVLSDRALSLTPC